MTWFKALRRLGRVDRHSDSRDPNGGPVASESKTERGRTGIRADNPIRQAEEDTLGRRKIAETFAQQVIALDVSEGVVVGVLGPWGSGKTSFVNLARTEFERAGVPILDFNPWMFSGAQQLVDSFFVEVAAQLKIRPGLGLLDVWMVPVIQPMTSPPPKCVEVVDSTTWRNTTLRRCLTTTCSRIESLLY